MPLRPSKSIRPRDIKRGIMKTKATSWLRTTGTGHHTPAVITFYPMLRLPSLTRGWNNLPTNKSEYKMAEMRFLRPTAWSGLKDYWNMATINICSSF